jgi:hypothetical protein
MWVKGTPLHFIVDSGIQKNLISTEVINVDIMVAAEVLTSTCNPDKNRIFQGSKKKP